MAKRPPKPPKTWTCPNCGHVCEGDLEPISHAILGCKRADDVTLEQKKRAEDQR